MGEKGESWRRQACKEEKETLWGGKSRNELTGKAGRARGRNSPCEKRAWRGTGKTALSRSYSTQSQVTA